MPSVVSEPRTYLEVSVYRTGDLSSEVNALDDVNVRASKTARLGDEGAEMDSLFAMRRANGDWFALDDRGRFRVPVFSSQSDGMLARVSHWGMLLFKPVALDGRALEELVPAGGVGDTDFWLVDNPFTSLNRGRSLDRGQLSLLVRDTA